MLPKAAWFSVSPVPVQQHQLGFLSGQGSWIMAFEVTVSLVRVRQSCLHSSVGACLSGKAADKAKVLEVICF